MAGVFFGLMIGLELKHYIADYFLQPAWMLAGKGNVFHAGGYAHAGIHAGMSLLVLLLVGTPIGLSLVRLMSSSSPSTLVNVWCM